MGFIAFLLLGVIAGVIAKFLLRDRRGWVATIIIGVLGALLGGWLGGLIFKVNYTEFFSLQSWVLAIGGALLLLLLLGLISGKQESRS